MDWDPFATVSCLIGIGLMVTAGRLRRRSLERPHELGRRMEASGGGLVVRSKGFKRKPAQIVRLRKSRPSRPALPQRDRLNEVRSADR